MDLDTSHGVCGPSPERSVDCYWKQMIDVKKRKLSKKMILSSRFMSKQCSFDFGTRICSQPPQNNQDGHVCRKKSITGLSSNPVFFICGWGHWVHIGLMTETLANVLVSITMGKCIHLALLKNVFLPPLSQQLICIDYNRFTFCLEVYLSI